MARAKTHQPLDIYLNSRLVGQLMKAASGEVSFKYDEDWLALDNALPVSLSLPLREDRFIGAPVLAVFDNLLPDNIEIRKSVAARMGVGHTDAYSLLSAVGRDCVGALQFLPEGEEPQALYAIEGQELDEEAIADILANLKSAPLGLGRDKGFRISIAGAQEKTALTKWKGQWLRPHGTTPTTHIIKPPIGQVAGGIALDNSVENEYFCMTLCRNLGLPVAKCEIAYFNDKPALAVERFDRRIEETRILRLPQEDMCQALGVPPELKYQSDGGPNMEDILIFLRGSDTPLPDQATFLKANIVFWLLGASDGHAKNFSIAMRPGGRFAMTPLYDILSVEPTFAAGTIEKSAYRLAMSAGTNRHYRMHEIMPRHFIQTASKAGVGAGDARAVCEEVAASAEAALAQTLDGLPDGFPGDLTGPIAEGFQGRLRILEHLD